MSHDWIANGSSHYLQLQFTCHWHTFCPCNSSNRVITIRRILARGSMPPCRLRGRKFWKFDYEMVRSEVYVNKYVVSIAPFSTPAFTPIPHSGNYCFFCIFSLSNFHPFFQEGVSWLHLPQCADAHEPSHTFSQQHLHKLSICWLS